jgi:hypothetical protein
MSESFWNINDLPTSSCCICLSQIHFQDSVSILLSCGHVYHYNCFVRLTNPSCPICRHPINITTPITNPSFTNHDISQLSPSRTIRISTFPQFFHEDEFIFLVSQFY